MYNNRNTSKPLISDMSTWDNHFLTQEIEKARDYWQSYVFGTVDNPDAFAFFCDRLEKLEKEAIRRNLYF
jgi:hypothetical protein